jgi:hypothetical protein
MAMTKYWDGMPEGEEYDFYGRGVRSVDDIRNYLRTWFRRVEGGDAWEGTVRTYTQVLGFKRASAVHAVFVDVATDDYIFAVDGEALSSGTYGTFDGVCDDIARFYARRWKVDEVADARS